MSIPTKFAVVFLCAAICGLSVTLIPRGERSQQNRNEATPVKLRDAKRSDWLLV